MQDLIRAIEVIENASPQLPELPQPFPLARSHRVPIMVRKAIDYDKYYVPKVVSIGPYHYGNPKLDLVEKLKPRFTMKLLLENRMRLERLYMKLGDMVQECRMFYEESPTNEFSDQELTKMMLFDGCFILYFIESFFGEKAGSSQELRSHEIALVHQDLFLLENQIPFMVLTEVMNLIEFDHRHNKIKLFVTENILATGRKKKGWFDFETTRPQNEQNDHLLHLLYCSLTRTSNANTQKYHEYRRYFSKSDRSINDINMQDKDADETSSRRTFHTVNELMDIGIRFKPSNIMSLQRVEFVRRCWWFSADIKLPPITVNMLLNLLAYELGSQDEWVASYICLLDSLIDHPEDVKALRNAGVLDNPLGNESDEEVAKLLKTIGLGLVPNYLAYSQVKKQIQSHYNRWRNTRLTDLKHEYIKSPWSLLALLGAVMVLFLSGVQTYFTVWSPKSECDDLCKFLKMHHHF